MLEEQILNEEKTQELEEIVEGNQSLESEEKVEGNQSLESEEKVEGKKAKKEKRPTVLFGVASVVFSHIADLSIFGLIFGIIGIIFGIKNRKKTDTPLALSLIGTSLSVMNIITIIYSYIMLIGYLLFTVLYVVLVLVLTGAGSASSGQVYY